MKVNLITTLEVGPLLTSAIHDQFVHPPRSKGGSDSLGNNLAKRIHLVFHKECIQKNKQATNKIKA